MRRHHHQQHPFAPAFEGFDPRGASGRGPRHPFVAAMDPGDRGEYGPPDGPGRGSGRGPGRGGRGGRGPGRHGRGPGGPHGGPWGRHGDPELPGFLPGGARAGRGDVRAGVLVLLLEGPMHGYQLISELRERSGGAWRPSPGSIYPTLKRLAAEGLVTSTEGEGRGGRRAHALTDEGRAEAERIAEQATPWDAVGAEGDADAVELRDLVVSVVEAARQVVRVAAPDQIEDAKATLVEARRRLYGILAAEPRRAEAAGADAEDAPAGDAPEGDGAEGDGAADERR